MLYSWSRFERGTAFDAWECRWAVLSRLLVGVVVNSRLVDTPFPRREQELFYCRKMQGDIEANREVAEGDSKLRSWF